jgi:hypothetical protein
MMMRCFTIILLFLRLETCTISAFTVVPTTLRQNPVQTRYYSASDPTPVEVLSQDDDDDDDEVDWLPDREKARKVREQGRIYAERLPKQEQIPESTKETQEVSGEQGERPSPYTQDEEEVIAAMGGKTFHPQRKRESGFLGDSTLQEIVQDYSIPISYLADVLCAWGVPAPIHVHDRLGDLTTGEQAFAILEAVNSLDVAALHDRYSDTNLINLCDYWDIDLQLAFELAMKEGWSLPFGVQTCLRVEQEQELVRVLTGRDSNE